MPRAKDLRDDTLLDIFDAETVGIQISDDGKRVWVCVDGICRFRVKGTLSLTVADGRKPSVEAVKRKRGRPKKGEMSVTDRKAYRAAKAREYRAKKKGAP